MWAGTTPGLGAPGGEAPFSRTGRASAECGAIGLAVPWPWFLAAPGFTPSDLNATREALSRLAGTRHGRTGVGSGRHPRSGFLTIVDRAGAVRELVREHLDSALNHEVLGCHVHLDVAVSWRRPGNGFVITRRF